MLVSQTTSKQTWGAHLQSKVYDNYFQYPIWEIGKGPFNLTHSMNLSADICRHTTPTYTVFVGPFDPPTLTALFHRILLVLPTELVH